MAGRENAVQEDAYALSRAPRSLLAGANRIHFERVVELFQRIRGDCDSAAASLGLATKDDGLAAVEFLAEAVIAAVRQERAARQPRRKSGPHDDSGERLIRDWVRYWKPRKELERAKPEILAKWIAEIDEDLRRGKTKAGKTITEREAEYLRDRRRRLEERLVTRKSRRAKMMDTPEIRGRFSEQLISTGRYGQPRKGQDAENYVREKLKRARRSAGKKK
jgi:hypothetical protein